MTTTTLIGPLTPEEWTSFALGDDERNPLPPCCSEISEVREAIFDTLAVGGNPLLAWHGIASVWEIVEGHSPVGEHPTLRKLHDAYVAGHERPSRQESFARLRARTLADTQPYLDLIGETFDVTGREGRVQALNRVGGLWVSYILDPADRVPAVRRLAELVGLDVDTVALVLDVQRAGHYLPYEPSH